MIITSDRGKYSITELNVRTVSLFRDIPIIAIEHPTK